MARWSCCWSPRGLRIAFTIDIEAQLIFYLRDDSNLLPYLCHAVCQWRPCPRRIGQEESLLLALTAIGTDRCIWWSACYLQPDGVELLGQLTIGNGIVIGSCGACWVT